MEEEITIDDRPASWVIPTKSGIELSSKEIEQIYKWERDCLQFGKRNSTNGMADIFFRSDATSKFKPTKFVICCDCMPQKAVVYVAGSGGHKTRHHMDNHPRGSSDQPPTKKAKMNAGVDIRSFISQEMPKFTMESKKLVTRLTAEMVIKSGHSYRSYGTKSFRHYIQQLVKVKLVPVCFLFTSFLGAFLVRTNKCQVGRAFRAVYKSWQQRNSRRCKVSFKRLSSRPHSSPSAPTTVNGMGIHTQLFVLISFLKMQRRLW